MFKEEKKREKKKLNEFWWIKISNNENIYI